METLGVALALIGSILPGLINRMFKTRFKFGYATEVATGLPVLVMVMVLLFLLSVFDAGMKGFQ